MHARRSHLYVLQALAVLFLSLASTAPASATTFYALVGNTLSLGESAPQSVGPLSIAGGVGSTGSASALCEAGRMKTFGSVACPVSGIFTPQIDADCIDNIMVLDIECPELPAEVATPYDLTLHTRLTGELTISGAHPYAASVSIGVSSSITDASGSVSLSGQGLTTTGLLAGASSQFVDHPVDIPVTLYLARSGADMLTLTLETQAGGTALGTEVNTATADFSTVGWQLDPIGPVFSGLPEGVTLNIPSLNVVNNHWLGPVTAVAVQGGGSLALAPAHNPGHGTVRFSLTLPADGPVQVEVFDLQGARRATLLDGWQVAGTRTLEWRASAEGARPGVYFVRATAGRERATARIVLVR
jgi:hypothetical protein